MRKERVVLVTGAAGGIGSEIVDRFLTDGDSVLATDASQDALDRWRERWPADARLRTTPADITSGEELGRLAATIAEQEGRVDVLVHAAGFFPIVSFEGMSEEQWRQVIEINLTGAYLLVKAVLPLMHGRGWGRIIAFGSGSVFDGTRNQTHYVAAKAGIVGFSRSLARELGGDGITVNVVTPGLTVTQAVRDSFPAEILEAQRAGRAIPRDEVPQDLVGPVAFLASPDADFITGQTINVDGGRFMR